MKLGKKSQLRNLGSSVKRKFQKTKQDLVLRKKVLSTVKKLRWTSEAAATELIKGLRKNSERYQQMSLDDKRKVETIVFEECANKPEYKAIDLIILARRIEKRVKKEIP